jgi:hypothetical protein
MPMLITTLWGAVIHMTMLITTLWSAVIHMPMLITTLWGAVIHMPMLITTLWGAVIHMPTLVFDDVDVYYKQRWGHCCKQPSDMVGEDIGCVVRCRCVLQATLGPLL